MKITKEIPGFPDYKIDTDGNVYSFKRSEIGLLMKPHKMPRYLGVGLFKDGKLFNKKIHHLLMFTFVGPRPQGMEIRHLNGISDDNRLENLCYGTRQENMDDSVRLGRTARGEGIPSSKLTENQVINIRKLFETTIPNKSKLARMHSVNVYTIRLLLKRVTWKHI